MRKCCSVVLLLLFGAAACNSIGLYPNVTLEDIGTPAVTAPFNLFIYTWPLEEQAKCPGNVTAIEYCFQRPSSTLIKPVFTLLLLKSLNYGYRISDTIVVTTKNFSFCSNRGGINTCCERKPLRQQNQFSVPSEIEAFGIFASGGNRILGYTLGQQSSTLGFQVPISAIQNDYVALPNTDMITITYRMFNFVVETSNSTTNEPTNGSSSIPDGEGNGSQTLMPVSDITTTTVISPSSSPISMATDFENEINHSSHTSSALTVTPSVGSTSSASQELPTNETTLNPEGASAPNSSSIPIVPSIIGGCIFALLHIIILVIVIYLCYRAKSGQKSDAAKVESVVNNPSMTSETDQPTAGYESIYAQAVPTNTQLCTNTNAEPIEDTDQYTYYESSNYTLPIDIHGVVLDRNPAYGCHDQFELEDPYASNSINKGLDKMNSYTKILPPTP